MKANRQKKIIELITEKSIETQEQLLQELHNCGFNSTTNGANHSTNNCKKELSLWIDT